MSYEIVKCSDSANVILAAKTVTTSKYPFDKLEVGESFAVPFEDVKETTLRVTASRYNRGDKKFSVIKHNNVGKFEVARVK